MRRLQLFTTVILVLFASAGISFAGLSGPVYTDDNMTLINAAVLQELASADIPEGIGVDVEFGQITGDIASLDAAVGKELKFVDQMVIADTSGANWAEEEAEEAIDFDTFLGAAGFHLDLADGATAAEETAAAVVTLKMELSKAFMIEQGVTETEADELFSEDPMEAQISFFDEFTYFKIFDGADPAIDPRDIVEFVKTSYTDELPGFIEFEIDREAETLTVGIRYVLLDEAPEDGEPFVIDKNIAISEDSEETQGVLFIYDGNKNEVLRDPVSLGNEEVTPTPSGSSGGCSAGLPLMLVLLGLPVLFYRKK